MSMRLSSASMIRQTVSDITERQYAVASAREQIASGQRINRPSDDPAAVGRLAGIKTAVARLGQFERNASSAESRLNIEEVTLAAVTSTVNRVRDLALQANNAHIGATERAAIAVEIDSRLTELFDLSNTRDANGDYLFSGSRTETRPFSAGTTAGAPVNYAGDDTARTIAIGIDRHVVSGHTGSDVFLRLRDGNGRVAVAADPANNGNAVVDQATVVDPAYTDRSYRIEFTSPSTFDVVDANAGTIVNAGQTFEPGAAIDVGGLRTRIDGQPASGDAFLLRPARQQDLFASLAGLHETLLAPNTGENGEALRRQGINAALSGFDGALEHLNETRARTGARLSSIDSSREETAAVSDQLKATGASLEDADITEVVTRLEREALSLELLQKSYARLARVSILDYL